MTASGGQNLMKLLKSALPSSVFIAMHWWLFIFTVYARFIYDDFEHHKDLYLILLACFLSIFVYSINIFVIECVFKIFNRLSIGFKVLYLLVLYCCFDLFIAQEVVNVLQIYGFFSLANGMVGVEAESSWFSSFFWSSLLYTYISIIMFVVYVIVKSSKRLIKKINGRFNQL